MLNIPKKLNFLTTFLSNTNNILPSLSTDAASISHLKTIKTIYDALIHVTSLFYLSKTNSSACYSKEIKSSHVLLEFRYLDSTSPNLNSSVLYIRVNELYHSISFALISIYIVSISALNLLYLSLIENYSNK